MDRLEGDLDSLNREIEKLESEIQNAEKEAEGNIEPLNKELAQIREDKRNFASKNDFESVENCRRRENNLKFKISAQWNRCSLLKEELSKMKKKRGDLESQIKLERDKIRRNDEIRFRMDIVLANYEKSRNLTQAAIDSNIDPDHVRQWQEWGRNDFNQTYSYFYSEILKIDEHFRNLESQKLKDDMNRVIEAYEKTGSLEKASEIADVSYDTVMYWYEWGCRGFGEENKYFFKKLNKIKKKIGTKD